MGRMVRRSGLVMKEFRRDAHVVETVPGALLRDMRFSLGMDTGKHFAAILCGITRDSRRYVLGEVATCEASITESCGEVKEMVLRVLADEFSVVEWEDAKEIVDIFMADPASQHKEDLMEHLDVAVGYEQLELLGSIDRVREWMKEGALFFVQSGLYEESEGRGILYEIGRYAWKTSVHKQESFSAQSQAPRKVDDHSIDALRFGLVPLDGLGPLAEVECRRDFNEAFAVHQRSAMMDGLKAAFRGESQLDFQEFSRVHGYE